ncbi:hypothetical protein [Paenibacillus shenyangensis]|uniref:hypothetical protein n=1 Tax=Paenibacillus sp. A9 TaxID=1284352 RepID=UPI00037CF60B|nr:hypothetical protein [Paenibacillus sp. A9]
MITDPYTPEIVQETIRFTELYTRMARQLFESLLTAKCNQNMSIEQKVSRFENVIEQDDLKPIWYKGQYWNIDPHGEHCLFKSDSGLPIEVRIHDNSWIDAGFFSHFLQHLPAAQVLVRRLKPADFHSVIQLFEYMTAQNLLIQLDGTNFKLQPIQ